MAQITEILLGNNFTETEATNDWTLDVNRGLYTGFSYEHVVGRCDDVTNQYKEIRENCMVDYDWMTSAEILDIESSSQQDRAIGSGAHKIRLVGLDGNWDKIVEDITLNGTSAVQTVNSYIRILRAFVIESGSYQSPNGRNDGNITFTSQTQGEQAYMQEDKGKTTGSRWTIPQGFEAYLTRVSVQAPDTRPIDFRLLIRNNANDVTNPFGGGRVVNSYDEIGARYEENLLSYRKLAQYSDIWAEAKTSQGSSIVNCTFDLIQVPIIT